MSNDSWGFPSYIVASKETREAISKSFKEGFDYIKKHPEMLGTGNPKVYGDGFRELEKTMDNTAHKVIDFFKDTFKFAKDHPEMLLASAPPKHSLFDD